MPETKHPLKVFLCHASADKPKVRDLYRYLRRRGIKPWFDEIDLVGGQDWQVEIPKALSTSDAIIICLTKNSVDKEGYIQKEIKFALDKALEMPEGRIFLIPVRFEECEVPFSLSRYQWVDLFDEAGYAKMMRALKFHASQLERKTVGLSSKDKKERKPALEKAEHEKEEYTDAAKMVLETKELEVAETADSENTELERLEYEVAEKAEHEKAEKDSAEKIGPEAREQIRQKATKEKVERGGTEKTDQQTHSEAPESEIGELEGHNPKRKLSTALITVLIVIGSTILIILFNSPLSPIVSPTAKVSETHYPTTKSVPTLTPDFCAPDHIEAQVMEVHNYMKEFDDASTLAASIPRDQLDNSIAELQKIRRKAEDQSVPDCLTNLKKYQIEHMAAVIKTLIELVSISDPQALDCDNVQSNTEATSICQNLYLAREKHDQYLLELARILGLTVEPATKTGKLP